MRQDTTKPTAIRSLVLDFMRGCHEQVRLATKSRMHAMRPSGRVSSRSVSRDSGVCTVVPPLGGARFPAEAGTTVLDTVRLSLLQIVQCGFDFVGLSFRGAL